MGQIGMRSAIERMPKPVLAGRGHAPVKLAETFGRTFDALTDTFTEL